MLIKKKTLSILISSITLIFWIIISLAFRDSKNLLYLKIAFSFTTFLLLSFLAIGAVIPKTQSNLRNYFKIWVTVKLIFGIIYFSSLYINRVGNLTTIVEYGDNFTHHYVAEAYSNFWKYGQFLSNPIEISSNIEQWGYSYFLGIIYYVTGPLPEVAVMINGFLALILCLLCFKLFNYTKASQIEVRTGVVFLSLMPMLWSLSSMIYKDMLLFTIVLLITILTFKLKNKIGVSSLLILFALLIPIFLIRYSYFFVMLAFFILGNITLRGKKIRNFLLIVPFMLIALIFVENFSLLNLGGFWDVWEYIKKSQMMDSQGGNFMVQSFGMINKTNFLIAIPLKSFYLLLIPFPWFQGNTLIVFIDHFFQNIDSLYCLIAVFFVIVTIMNRKIAIINKERKLLLLIAVIFFCIPLFMFYPSRRYITIALPFFIAFSLPLLQNRKMVLYAIFTSIAIIISTHLAYYII